MIPLFKVFMAPEAPQRVSEVLQSGYIGQGAKVEEFEKALVPWVGRDQILTTNSCTSAIHLALRIAGVGPWDEIITTPMTCFATNAPIAALGAIPVWADVYPETGNIDPADVRKKITPKTKAILAVHWGGNPCDIDALNAIGKDYGIPVIEDAAHAFGATYGGRPIGSHSDFVCFSFQAIKHLTTGDGGLLTCRRKEDFERAKLLRWYGIDRAVPGTFLNDIPEAGYKFHMNDIAAAIGLANLPHMAPLINRCRQNVFTLSGRLPISSCWLYTLRRKDREAFVKRLKEAGIEASQVHARNDKYSCFKDHQRDLPGVDAFSREQVNIPCGWWLAGKDLQTIAEVVP